MTVALTAGMAAALGALLLAERRRWSLGRLTFKLLASLCFLAIGWLRFAPGDGWGSWLVLGLALSLLGDLLLVGEHTFPAGLGAFLAAHLAYLAACHAMLPAREWPFHLAAPVLVASAVVARWLWPHLRRLRAAVMAYVVVITLMVWGAASVTLAGAAPWTLGAGALLFYLSDLAVARNRFVAPGFVNRAWGLPAYYAGQALIAWTVGS